MNKDYRRAIHIDFHTLPGVYDINEFDAEKFGKTLFDAHVTFVNVFAQCNMGFCYYPTKIGIVYPGLTRDLLGEMIEVLHRYGIGVAAYFNVGLNHALLHKHPEWRTVDKDGKTEKPPVNEKGEDNVWITNGCFYNKGYKEYLKSLISEVNDNYDIDGIFCDCIDPTRPCYCEHCKEGMRKQGLDVNDDTAVLKFRKEATESFASEVRAIVADKHTFFNGVPFHSENQDHIEVECLPNCWSYDFFAPYAAFARSAEKETTYMTGRFQFCWGDFGGVCSKASLQYDMYDAVMSGFGFCVGDHKGPADPLIEPLYKNIGEVNEEYQKYEDYIRDVKYKADICVMSACHYMWDHMGLGRMLGECKYSFDIVRSDKDISKYKLVILPEDMLIDEKTAEKLEKYLANGGKIISCGKGGLNTEKTDFALKAYRDAFEFKGIDTRTNAFFKFNDQIETEYRNVKWSTYKNSIKVKPKNCQIIARDVDLYFDKHFDGVFNFYYLPPNKETENCAVAKTDNIAHVSFDFFEAYEQHFLAAHREIFKILIKEMLPDPWIKADEMPIYSRISVTEAKEHINVGVKVTYPEAKRFRGVLDEQLVLKGGRKFLVKGEYKSATEVKTGAKIAFSKKGEYTEITLPEIEGFTLIVLEKI